MRSAIAWECGVDHYLSLGGLLELIKVSRDKAVDCGLQSVVLKLQSIKIGRKLKPR